MALLTIFLNIPGSPVPDWLVFLTPFVLLLIVMKTGRWLNKWIRSYIIPKFFKKKKQDDDIATLFDNISLNISQ